jgi:hypothetical protein
MRRFLAAGILLSLLTAPAFAQKPITVTGCVAKGVEFGCLVLRTITGKSYNISAAQPAPMVGTYGTVTGILQPGRITFCQQGEVIDPAAWKMRGKFCPKAKR